MLIYGIELIEADDMVIHHQRRTQKPFECVSIAAWIEAAASGRAVDVGAYTGLYAILAAKAGAASIAFEPNPAAFARLVENVEANAVRVECHQAAVSDISGSARFVGKPRMNLTSAGRIVAGDGVATIRLDDLNLDGVAAIKIDVEGHEDAVLRGAINTISAYRPLIITEALSDEALTGQQALLEPLNYTGEPADDRNLIWRP